MCLCFSQWTIIIEILPHKNVCEWIYAKFFTFNFSSSLSLPCWVNKQRYYVFAKNPTHINCSDVHKVAKGNERKNISLTVQKQENI